MSLESAGTSVHPMYNDNPFKVGVFGLNLRGGLSMTTAEGVIDGRWATQTDLVRAADKAGYEFVLPVARWRGMTGPSHYTKDVLEVFTWAAAVAAMTENIGIFATAHVPLYHPLLAAKMSATIDDIASGRFGVNIVAGWNADEFDMFDIKQLPHDERYIASGEWVEILTGLWIDESVTYEGSYFSVHDAQISPRPTSPPVLVNAGVSPTGIEFAAKYMDFSFQAYPGEEMFAQNVSGVRRLAEEKYDRKLGVLASAQIVCADTEAEAQRYYEYYVNEKGDFEGAEQAVSLLLGGDSRSFGKEQFAQLQQSLVASFGSLCLVGTAEQIAERLVGLHGMGVDGVALQFVDYAEGIDRFTSDIMPLLREAGLRR